MFNFFEELFAPGRKHTHEERNRLALSREDIGDADPGQGPIDLESGKVVVRTAGDGEQPTAATVHEAAATARTAAERDCGPTADLGPSSPTDLGPFAGTDAVLPQRERRPTDDPESPDPSPDPDPS